MLVRTKRKITRRGECASQPDAVQDKLIVFPSTTDIGWRLTSNVGSTPFFSTVSTTSDTSVDYDQKKHPFASART